MPKIRLTRAQLLGGLAVKAAVGVGLLATLGAAPVAGATNWFTTGIWVGAGLVAFIVLAFLLGRLLPKDKDDNPDIPL
jgi:hypothetical protein